MATEFSLTRNIFDNCTKNNFKKMLLIGGYTDNSLAPHIADPDILEAYNFIHPLYDAYNTEYSNLFGSEGTHIGKTDTLDNLLSKLSNPLIGDWDIAIQGVYHRTTEQYKTLLPHQRIPFQTGNKDSRINAVHTLYKALTAIGSLDALETTVENFYDDLDKARNEQQGAISDTKIDSSVLETKRVALANGMMFVYGCLIKKYYADLLQIKPYFDTTNIQEQKQKDYTVTVNPQSAKKVFKKTFAPTDQLKVKNTGANEIKVCMKFSSTDTCTTGITIAPDSEQTFAASALGNITTDKFFIVTNTTDVEAKCVVTLL